jgi:hypothetical protein
LDEREFHGGFDAGGGICWRVEIVVLWLCVGELEAVWGAWALGVGIEPLVKLVRGRGTSVGALEALPQHEL